jgi:hypothetical protein
MRAWNFCLILLSIVGSVATIIVAFQQWYPPATADGRVAIVFLASFLAATACVAIWQEYRYSRKARYAEALALIAEVFTELSLRRPESDRLD